MNTTTLPSPTATTMTGIPEAMLESFRGRAAALDRANAYFESDLADLRSIGYLAAAVPAEFGGWGLDLAQLAASQRRLARYAPATALAMTMHGYWVGIAQHLHQLGDDSLHWVFDAVLAGEVIAAGHAEAGNDMPVLLSTATATRVAGGYLISGTQAVRLQRTRVALARCARDGRGGAGRPPGRPRVHRAHQPRRPGRGDVGHPGDAADTEPRHGSGGGLRAR